MVPTAILEAESRTLSEILVDAPETASVALPSNPSSSGRTESTSIGAPGLSRDHCAALEVLLSLFGEPTWFSGDVVAADEGFEARSAISQWFGAVVRRAG